MRKYNIGEAAKIMGISSESLRNYERRGLLAPLRDENGYRTYTRADIYLLSTIRVLRNAGYSFSSINHLLGASYEEALRTKQQRCAEMEEELMHLQLKLQALKDECEEYQALKKNAKNIRETVSPAMLRINNQINDEFLLHHKGIQRWIRHLPAVRISPSFSREAVLQARHEVRFGYAVSLEHAARLHLDATPGAEVMPPRSCLSTIIHSRGENYLHAGMLHEVLRYCAENALEIDGDAWGITLGAHIEEGEACRYHRFYIPIKKRA